MECVNLWICGGNRVEHYFGIHKLWDSEKIKVVVITFFAGGCGLDSLVHIGNQAHGLLYSNHLMPQLVRLPEEFHPQFAKRV